MFLCVISFILLYQAGLTVIYHSVGISSHSTLVSNISTKMVSALVDDAESMCEH